MHMSKCPSQDNAKEVLYPVLYPSEPKMPPPCYQTALERCPTMPALIWPLRLTLVNPQSNVVHVCGLVYPYRMSRDESAGCWAPDLTVTSSVCPFTLPLEVPKLLHSCPLGRVRVTASLPRDSRLRSQTSCHNELASEPLSMSAQECFPAWKNKGLKTVTLASPAAFGQRLS